MAVEVADPHRVDMHARLARELPRRLTPCRPVLAGNVDRGAAAALISRLAAPVGLAGVDRREAASR
jgi:hypothetical protein